MSEKVVIPIERPQHRIAGGAMALELPILRQVAGYARVSTGDEEQQTSYEAQVDYYTRFIQQHPDWVYAGMYTDEGITGTSMKKRDGFNRMIQDAMEGKIDLIVTKSVSRFARNTVDSLITIRKLKEKGVEVFFEKENIYTLDSKGELLITLMSSLAQEESRSISENVTWGHRKRFADGKVTMAYKHFLGYTKGQDGTPAIVPEEAAVVRRIYKLFLDGESLHSIAATLMDSGIPSPGGKKKWSTSTLESILTNEKYKGDAILQKTFTVNFLTKEVKVNEGEVQQYYVKNSHPAIVSEEVFDLAQEDMRRRKRRGAKNQNASCFGGRVFCADCGATYGSKVWHSTSKYRRTIWQCNRKFANEEKCGTPHLTEEALRQAFVAVINRRIENRDAIIAAYEEIIALLSDTSALERDAERLETQRMVVLQQIRELVAENASRPLNQDAYKQRFAALNAKLDVVQTKVRKIEEADLERRARMLRMQVFMDTLKQSTALINEFDEGLFNSVVAGITVGSDGHMMFTFRDGSEERYEG